MKLPFPLSIAVFRVCIFLFCCAFSVSAFGQTGSISGHVATSEGEPAAFVNIMLKGTNKGTQSNEKGDFIIKNIKEGNYILEATFVGMQPEEKAVTVVADQKSEVVFTLTSSAIQLAEVAVTAKKSVNQDKLAVSKLPVRAKDLPQSMAVIGTKVIEEQQASKLSDVIKNVNGVALGTTRGSTSETFFARGYNLGANNIFRNGARSNSAVIAEASTLERVEVLKGSAALLYGNVSGGAVINLVTKKPQYKWGGEVALRAGSYNLIKPIIDVYGPITQNLAFRVVGTYETAESYRNNVESERYYVNPSLMYKLGAKTTILVQGDYLKNDFTPDFGIGSLDGKIPTNISRSAFFNTPWAYNNVEQNTSSVNVDHQLSTDWALNLIVSQQQFKRDYFSTERIHANAAGDWARRVTRSDISEDYYTAQTNLTGKLSTGKLQHTVLIGADAEQYMNKTHTFDIATLKGGVYDTINVLQADKFTPRTDMPEATATIRTETPTYRFGGYIQDLISVSEKFKVLAGVRYSYQKVAVAKLYDLKKGEVKNSESATTRYDRALSPRVGLVYQPTNATSFFASYSNNFTPNTGKDVNEQNLKPSVIDQYEAGIKNDLVKGHLTANFTVYHIINNDLALQAQYLADGVTLNTDANIKEFTGQTTSDGAELDLSGYIIPGLDYIAGYSYNFMRYTKTSDTKGSYLVGERLVSNPAHTANASLFYTVKSTALKGMRLGVSGFYTGQRNAGWNNRIGQAEQYNRLIPVKGFTTMDVSLGYTYKKVAVIGKLSNITNELNYYVHENYSVNPIPPRQFVTTISYKF